MPTGPLDLSDEEEITIGEESFDVADLFVAPGGDEEVGPSMAEVEAFDAMNQLMVQVRVDEIDVPIHIDGREAGLVPGLITVTPGVHTVELYYRGQMSRFRLEADVDPDLWCFERRGREFKVVRC